MAVADVFDPQLVAGRKRVRRSSEKVHINQHEEVRLMLGRAGVIRPVYNPPPLYLLE